MHPATIQIDKTEEPIIDWKVAFNTPFGVCYNLAEAVKRVQESDLDPNLVVRPVVVACSETCQEVCQ